MTMAPRSLDTTDSAPSAKAGLLFGLMEMFSLSITFGSSMSSRISLAALIGYLSLCLRFVELIVERACLPCFCEK